MKLKHKKSFIFTISLLASAIVFPMGLSDWITSGNTIGTEFNTQGPYVCHIGDTYYRQIGKAIESATSGQTIEVIPGNTNRNSKYYTITPTSGTKLEIKQGVKLSIPYKEGEENLKKAKSNEPGGALTKRNAFCKSSVILGDNVTLENNGTIEIGGILTAPGGSAPTGRTGGDYAELMLGSGSKLINHNLIDVYGLLGEKKETDYSSIKNYQEPLVTLIQSSSNTEITPQLNMPMCWYDFCGGSTLKAVYDKVDKQKCLPLDDFFFENVTAKTKVHSGSIIKTWVNLYASKYFAEYDLTLVSKDNSGVISLQDDTSYFIFKYNDSSLRNALDFYNSATFNAFTIDVKKAIINTLGEIEGNAAWLFLRLAIPSKVSTSDGFYPISHHFSISLNKDENGTGSFDGSSNEYKLLNGSSLRITEGCSLTCKSMAVYKGDDVNAGKYGPAANIKKCKNDITPAYLLVNGELRGQTLAGRIQTSAQNANIIVSSKTSLTMHEPKGGSGKTVSDWYNIDLNLNTLDSTGNYVDQSSVKTYISKKGSGFYYFE